jgi:hypothetical protein
LPDASAPGASALTQAATTWPARRLRWQLLALAGVLVALEGMTRAYSARHFIPNQRLAAALEAGNRCVAWSGGSDMVSALDTPAFLSAWRDRPAPCVADLSLGATSADTRFMEFRRYVQQGGKPRALVLGFKGHAITDDVELRPGYHTGNNAAVFEWGKFSDLARYYPRVSFTAFDNSLRFLLFSVTAIGAHRESLWLKVNQLEQRLGLLPKSATNSFGNVEAFRELEAENRQAALASRDSQTSLHWQLMPWTAAFVAEAERAGVEHVSFVRLPALSATEGVYFHAAAAEGRFSSFVSDLARAHGGTYIDLAHAPWMHDSLLMDGLHYRPEGAALISRAVGEALHAQEELRASAR